MRSTRALALLLLASCGAAAELGSTQQAVSDCAGEGVVTCTAGAAAACWPLAATDGGSPDRKSLMRTGLGSCAAGPVALGEACADGDPLHCLGGASVACLAGAGADGGVARVWTRLDPYWFACSW